jgi:D-threo-aldose 1-dehydrogenase
MSGTAAPHDIGIGARLGPLGFGGAPLGNLFQPVAEAEAEATIDGAWAEGIRYFDTAPLYGHGLSERRLGRALSRRPRSDFIISTKVGRLLRPADSAVDGGVYRDIPAFEAVYDYSYDGALRSVEASLERLGLDRVDILYIHDIDRWTHGEDQPARYAEAMQGAYRALRRLRDEGVVAAIGLGVNEWEVCERAAREAEFDCFLLAGRYTLLEQAALASFLPLCVERSIWIALGGPFNSGILATGARPGATYNYAPAPPEVLERVARLEAVCRRHGTPLAAAALQFPLAHPVIRCVVAGARSVAEVEQNRALLDKKIPPDLWAELKAEGLIAAEAPTP